MIDVAHLTVAYGRHVALAGVHFDLPVGAFLAIVGPNGSGKSTLIKVLLGLQRPSAGSVRLYEQPPNQVPAAWLGYVPQIKTLDRTFPAIACELVATGLHRRWPLWLGRREHAAIHAALDRVGVSHLSHRAVSQLSGGELQRVYLARALVRAPRLMLLDEPATGIDVKGEADFYALLESYHHESGATIVMVTHDWAAALHHATHVLLLKGHQVAFGPPVHVLTDAHMRNAFGHVGHTHEHVHAEDAHV
jgi:zinc transport system ATP-binding protein